MNKILIVDDDEITVQLIEFLLCKNGYDVVTALNGKEGYDKIIQERPDLVLMDIMMPVMSGIEVCEKIRTEGIKNSPPIILLTALGQDAEVIKGIQCGAVSYIIKPFDPKNLLKTIHELLSQAAG